MDLKAFEPLLLTLGFLLAGDVLAGNQVVLQASQDNSIYEPLSEMADPLSNGAGSFLFAGRTGLDAGYKLRRALLKFDVASALPEGAVVTHAEITLYQSKAAPGSPLANMGLHRVLEAWGEGASNALGAEGQGAPAEPGDATWSHRIHPGQAWSTPGGAFVAEASTSTDVGQILQHYHWGCSQALLDDINNWLQFPESNHGWILTGGEAAGQSAHRFNSRENSNADSRPLLSISYVTTDVLFANGFEAPECP